MDRPLSRGAWGNSGTRNIGGTIHRTGPFMFRLTLCGLPAEPEHRTNIDRNRTTYKKCQRCRA